MSRRGDNIRKRADGRWEGRYRIRLEGGETRYRSVYGKSYGEVKDKIADIIHRTYRVEEFYGNSLSAEAQKAWHNAGFCTLVEEWLDEIEKNRKYST